MGEKKKNELKGRIFNIMQYLQHPTTGEVLLTQETVHDVLLKYSTITKWAYIIHGADVKEDGTPKPSHFHIVLQTENNLTAVSTIAKWFRIPENFIDVPKGKGAFLDCVAYLTHEYHPDKTRYPESDVVSNFDWQPAVQTMMMRKAKYGKTTLNQVDEWIVDIMENGKTLDSCRLENCIEYSRNLRLLRQSRLVYLSKLNPPLLRINILISGRSGMGKSLASRGIARQFCQHLKYDSEIFFEVGASNVTFEGYDGQPVIIWNDARASTLIHTLGSRDNLFDIFDPHPTSKQQNIKYGSVNLVNSINIINTVQPIDEFCDGIAGEYTNKLGIKVQAEDKNQAYRRVPFACELTEEQIAMFINKGYIFNTNAFQQFELYKTFCGNLGVFRRKLQALGYLPEVIDIAGRKYDKKILEPVITCMNDLLSTAEAKTLNKVSDDTDLDALAETLIKQHGDLLPRVYNKDDFKDFKFGDKKLSTDQDSEDPGDAIEYNYPEEEDDE